MSIGSVLDEDKPSKAIIRPTQPVFPLCEDVAMFSDPEWAANEEWDTYAWFGFAIAEAQLVERHLLVIATALAMSGEGTGFSASSWVDLYDRRAGRMTLGQLLREVKCHQSLPSGLIGDDLIEDLKRVVKTRNDLAHEFFWPHSESEDEMSPEVARQRLMAAASLFSYVSCRLEPIGHTLLGHLHVNVAAVDEKLASVLAEPA